MSDIKELLLEAANELRNLAYMHDYHGNATPYVLSEKLSLAAREVEEKSEAKEIVQNVIDSVVYQRVTPAKSQKGASMFIPEKKKYYFQQSEGLVHEAMGWNKCIDAILKKKMESDIEVLKDALKQISTLFDLNHPYDLTEYVHLSHKIARISNNALDSIE